MDPVITYVKHHINESSVDKLWTYINRLGLVVRKDATPMELRNVLLAEIDGNDPASAKGANRVGAVIEDGKTQKFSYMNEKGKQVIGYRWVPGINPVALQEYVDKLANNGVAMPEED